MSDIPSSRHNSTRQARPRRLLCWPVTHKGLSTDTRDLDVEPLNLPLHDPSCWLLARVKGS